MTEIDIGRRTRSKSDVESNGNCVPSFLGCTCRKREAASCSANIERKERPSSTIAAIQCLFFCSIVLSSFQLPDLGRWSTQRCNVARQGILAKFEPRLATRLSESCGQAQPRSSLQQRSQTAAIRQHAKKSVPESRNNRNVEGSAGEGGEGVGAAMIGRRARSRGGMLGACWALRGCLGRSCPASPVGAR